MKWQEHQYEENYRPRPTREVEYYGVSISIPADHEWVAPDDAWIQRITDSE